MTKLQVGTIRHATGSGTISLPAYNKIRGIDVGSIRSPGMVLQSSFLRTDTKAAYTAGVGTNTEVTDLTISITPKYNTSLIWLTYMVSFEMHHDTIFRLSRNGTVIGTNTTDSGRWSGWAVPGYDVDNNSTMRRNHHIYIDNPATTSTLTYRFLVSSSGGTAYTFYLNRTIGAVGQASYEAAISHVLVQEIAQ